ncbi:chromosome-anchoring protein RacA [Bacillus alkalicellulosilyticus]|uniref:chromosome-anchoring protein RacA n=1 Tax=Alkalihalobacterium alkalicellulosilyticum TaxID=1912214 RepID=UPI000995E98A|nr:chromosome-anchoring protein RacA [Bacillus alkalicellulosilyticus]
MDNVFETKEVSELLGVNPTTIKKWVKYFNLRCSINEQGHYLFQNSQVEVLKDIKGQLYSGKKMRDVHVSMNSEKSKTKKEERVQAYQLEYKLNQIVSKIDQFEQKLSQKADEVVSYQLLRHRSEIDDITLMLQSIEQRLQSIEVKVSSQVDEEQPYQAEIKLKKRSLSQIFSS